MASPTRMRSRSLTGPTIRGSTGGMGPREKDAPSATDGVLEALEERTTAPDDGLERGVVPRLEVVGDVEAEEGGKDARLGRGEDEAGPVVWGVARHGRHPTPSR